MDNFHIVLLALVVIFYGVHALTGLRKLTRLVRRIVSRFQIAPLVKRLAERAAFISGIIVFASPAVEHFIRFIQQLSALSVHSV